MSGSFSRTQWYFHSGSLALADTAPVSRINRSTLKMFSPSTLIPVAMYRENCFAARVSMQLIERRSARPCSSTMTSVCICEQNETPAISSFGTPAFSKRRFVLRHIAAHHSSGSCSAPPFGRMYSS